MKWPAGWSKPTWRKRRGNTTLRFNPFKPSVGASHKLGPLSITTSGRVYLLGAYIGNLKDIGGD
jgi:hypothetical protein